MDWNSLELFSERQYHSLLSQWCQSMNQHPSGVMCPDAHPHAGVFGEFSPVLDIATLYHLHSDIWTYEALLQNNPPWQGACNWGKKEGWELWYKLPLLSYVLSLLYTYTHAHTHEVHTFYILDFSFLRFPLRAVCCHLISLHLFYDKARRGADSVARLAWFGSSLLFLQRSHLSQGRAVDMQLRLLTRNPCRVGGSGKDFPCEG